MAGKADFLENAVLNHFFRGTDLGVNPATLYVALFTTTPAGDAGTGGVEAAFGGYARAAVASVAGSWKDPAIATQGRVENLAKIVFNPNNGPDAATINGAGIYDALSGGNLLWFDSLAAPVTVNRQDQFRFDENQLIIAEG